MTTSLTPSTPRISALTLEQRKRMTVPGLGLAIALRKPRTMPDPEVDWTAWIEDIEAAAKAEAVAQRDRLRDALLRLADDWSGDAEFLEDGDEVHNRRRVVVRTRKATPRELAAEAARQCAVQLRAALTDPAAPNGK